MLNPEKKNQHEELVGNIPSLKQKVKLVGYSNLKEKVLLVALRELENIIVKDESAYEIAEKENKRIGLSFAIMLIACCVFTY
ncbi:MAG: hypothetical protein KAS78_00130, partial [Candidatus Pacebacteria bacterium]|nr:hypothetical protein [Candidatus Paceibacterota bacterium]